MDVFNSLLHVLTAFVCVARTITAPQSVLLGVYCASLNPNAFIRSLLPPLLWRGRGRLATQMIRHRRMNFYPFFASLHESPFGETSAEP